MVEEKQKSHLISANFGLAILAFINLFSYLDRYVVSGVLESLKHSDLGLSDTNLGSLMSGFLVVYTLLAPVFGSLGDRRSRPRLIALGVACWSFATALSGFAVNFLTLFAARAAVGVGEAAYVTIAPSLLADYFPVRQRGRVMAIFFCAIPVGSALGYVVGGLVDKSYGWRAAFFVAGVPGLLLAALCLLLPDPPRGIQDRVAGAAGRDEVQAAPASQSSIGREAWLTYARLIRNKPYAITVLGYAAYTFALGGLAYWMPTFLERARGITRSEATVSFGVIVVVTGFVGTFVGGWMGDYFARHSRQAYLWLSAIATLIAAPFVWVALTTSSHSLYLVCMVTAQLCLFLSTGPINAAIINLVLASERATAIALSVFAIHILGDALSPLMVGALSDAFSLQQAVKILPVAVLIGGFVWIWAARAQASSKPAL
ncbi:MAG: transporter, Spinster family, sphingosine-phosphate transporter [Gammaproteobacteria bacterium]|nr:transporter, Spinster family, sphingosine-phosphate transporter [Gammaproteobacteria bacterium]